MYNKKKDFTRVFLKEYFTNTIDYHIFYKNKIKIFDLNKNEKQLADGINIFSYILIWLYLLIKKNKFQVLDNFNCNEAIVKIKKFWWDEIQFYLSQNNYKIDINFSFETKSANILLDYFQHLYNKIKNNKKKHILLFSLFAYFKFKANAFDKLICKISYLIELDQNASGPQLYSLLTRDTNMCYKTNLFKNENSIKKDLYLDYLDPWVKDLKKNISLEIIKRRNVLKTNDNTINQNDLINNEMLINDLNYLIKNIDNIFDREFSKKIIMPKFYAMTHYGIFKKLDDVDGLEFSIFTNSQYIKKYYQI